MPILIRDLQMQVETKNLVVSMEPVHNILHSLMLLEASEEVFGLNDWVNRTLSVMSPEELQTNKIVMHGFFFAIRPPRRFDSFTEYLEVLKNIDPQELQDRQLNGLKEMNECEECETPPTIAYDREWLLTSVDNYLAFIEDRFGKNKVKTDIEKAAYSYLINPPAMKKLMVDHLTHMWESYLKTEWEHALPLIEASLKSFQNYDLDAMGRGNAARFVTGRDFDDERWETLMMGSPKVRFIPNPHLGPYISMVDGPGYSIILFGTRQPSGAKGGVPELNRTEILNRLNALADDARLQILKFITERGELRSQEIIDLLSLGQSTASRHLTQLVASGFLTERRCETAKCYQINKERMRDTLQALEAYFLGENGS